MMPNFSKFIHFGTIGDENTRKELAEQIFLSLQNSAYLPDISNEQTDNFSGAIHSILNNITLHEMCKDNEELSEKITSDILDFVNKTKKLIDKTENPFENECNLLKQ